MRVCVCVRLCASSPPASYGIVWKNTYFLCGNSHMHTGRASDIAKESAAAGPTGKSYAGANIVRFLFVAFGCVRASAGKGIFYLLDPAGKNGNGDGI